MESRTVGEGRVTFALVLFSAPGSFNPARSDCPLAEHGNHAYLSGVAVIQSVLTRKYKSTERA